MEEKGHSIAAEPKVVTFPPENETDCESVCKQDLWKLK